LPKRPTLYDATIERLKNNKAIVAVLLTGAVVTGLLSFVGQVRSFVTASWSRKHSISLPAATVEFSRVVLNPGEYWEMMPREFPNHFYESAKSQADPGLLEDLEKAKKEGEYDCPYMFASPAWCRKSAAFFSQKGLQNIAIDPRFDILITNKRKEPVVVHSVGIEISYAEMITVSLGDWETTKVKVDGQYQILMPRPPMKVLVDKKVVDISAELKESGLWTEDTLDSRGVRSLLQSDFEWLNLPMIVSAPSADPVYLPPGAPYRFEVVLKRYDRMPNNVVVRFVVHTNYGDIMSDYFYLLAM
jgi:hypothetical protein